MGGQAPAGRVAGSRNSVAGLARKFHQQLAEGWEAGSRGVAAVEGAAAGIKSAQPGSIATVAGGARSGLSEFGHTAARTSAREAID